MKTFTFKGKWLISSITDEIKIESMDRESAIAYIEFSYPTFKWLQKTEIKSKP